MFVKIEGPLVALRGLIQISGLDLAAGVHDLGGGRWRASAYAESPSAVDEVRARGLTVTVILDEDETNRRMDADHEMMRAALDGGGDDGTPA